MASSSDGFWYPVTSPNDDVGVSTGRESSSQSTSGKGTTDCKQGRPLEGLCPVCGKVFTHPQRKQGGGCLKKYCSPKCRSLDWVRGNGGKRKASITKYESKPENKDKKRRATKCRMLKIRYGWSEADFIRELERQSYSCYGCSDRIDYFTANVDHNHKTNKIRGLLCISCNWAIGHLNDDPMVLRRLMAYLERDREKCLVYLGGSLRNPRVPEVAIAMRKCGFDVMDEWFTPGPHADENWQKYEQQRGRSYQDALYGRAASNIFMFDRAYLDIADIFVLVAPAGKSAMLELGYAKACGKKTFVFLDGQEPDRYDIMPQMADGVYTNLDRLIKVMEEL